MSILSTISEALHLYGKSINRNAVTNVTVSFRNTLTDLPATSPTWEVTIKLSGDRYTGDLQVFNREPAEDASTVDPKAFENIFSQEFKGEADSEEVALKIAYEQIKGRVEFLLREREEETSFAQQAMMAVTTDLQMDLSTLWPSSNASSDVVVDGT